MNLLNALIPEIVLCLTLIGLVITETAYASEKYRLVIWTALLGLFTAGVRLVFDYALLGQSLYDKTILIDGVSIFFHFLFIFLGVLTVIAVSFSKEISPSRYGEMFIFLIAAVLTQFVATSAGDLLLIFVSLQAFVALSVFLLGADRQSATSAEAGYKLLVFQVLSSFFFLLAAAVLYQATRSFNIYEIKSILAQTPLDSGQLLIVFACFFSSVAFQLGIFPLYFWTVDVFDGAPTPSAAYLALAFPMTAVAYFLRITIVIFAGKDPADASHFVFPGNWGEILSFCAGLTVLIGALGSMHQKSLKRTLSYLMLSQMGFAFLGVVVLDHQSLAAAMYHWTTLLFSVSGVFASYSFLFDATQSPVLSDFRGIFYKRPIETLCFIVFLACFLGLPPSPGYLSQFTLLDSVVKQHRLVLGAASVFSWVLWIIVLGKITFVLTQRTDSPVSVSADSGESRFRRIFLLSLMVPVALLICFAESVLQWTRSSIQWVLW